MKQGLNVGLIALLAWSVSDQTLAANWKSYTTKDGRIVVSCQCGDEVFLMLVTGYPPHSMMTGHCSRSGASGPKPRATVAPSRSRFRGRISFMAF
jgi:hypothetical protein